MKKYFYKIALHFFSGFLLFTTVSSADGNLASKKQIVAEVNGIAIYAGEFIQNYEFGFPHLKTGSSLNEKKRSYLNFMINEKMLALEAEKLGLLNSSQFINSLNKIEKGILLQHFVNKEIKQNIDVSFEEASQYLNKSKVEVKLILWPELTYQDAKIVKDLLDKNGLEKTIKIISSDNPSVNLNVKEFETDYLNVSEIPDELLEQISNLQAGITSEPVKLGDYYYIINIKDIRRSSITEREYYEKYPTVRKVLFSNKVQQRLSFFVDSLLSPKNIRTDKHQFNQLLTLIRKWKTDNKSEAISLEEYLRECVRIKDEQVNLLNPESIIVKFENGQISMLEFFDYLNFDMIPVDEIYHENFPAKLNQVIGISIRDYFLLKYAVENNYSLDLEVKEEMKKWKSKLAFDEYKSYLINNSEMTRQQLSSLMEKDSEKLYSKYKVVVYDDVLNNVEISETDKSSKSFYPVYLSGINRMSQPIIDGNWR